MRCVSQSWRRVFGFSMKERATFAAFEVAGALAAFVCAALLAAQRNLFRAPDSPPHINAVNDHGRDCPLCSTPQRPLEASEMSDSRSCD